MRRLIGSAGLVAKGAWSLSFAEFLWKSFCLADFLNLGSKVHNVYGPVLLAVLEKLLNLGIWVAQGHWVKCLFESSLFKHVSSSSVEFLEALQQINTLQVGLPVQLSEKCVSGRFLGLVDNSLNENWDADLTSLAEVSPFYQLCELISVNTRNFSLNLLLEFLSAYNSFVVSQFDFDPGPADEHLPRDLLYFFAPLLVEWAGLCH